MEDIYKDLNIPKKQIRATSNENPKKFQALVHKTWIKSIIENKKLLHSAPVYKDEDINIEWPKKHDLDVGWDFVYIVVSVFFLFHMFWMFSTKFTSDSYFRSIKNSR